ncbi:CDP-glycerol glycerophosphotransferase family protein [Romboutsia sp. 1001216sp1]|uniref:CDP-glycerol glycerophosphotransferase family protein n=1 Tax=Romboutsia TaxID=1501226 RepID=UPI000B889ECC|nr:MULTISPECIES: CDP-glycerol glycerophosphotransferase family protein [Romboutsia]MDB8792737.1 CDP-glycerol glycerophosphotransferase family protein [Romboutsia sp. 1001216sp1]MDB8795461.1 CDP-glycerol glycerophosphotransferase family protein [Romboutsia sp. 1001216sp1]MDB8799271.1 CDP-glycerol glycerophosphotransferase family protein [Romboutsia sp. 1001216sp1]MDB8802070.1 CDP-glycerol glycerophosphotransferase family protein [Romboutsia sp. 1001216sp1]MDB8813467.1 CDP-glycerol glycerophosph
MNKIKILMNMVVAAAIYPFKKSNFKGKNIWLIGGHAGDIYDDNSKFLYEYILKNHKEIDIYWVIDESSKVKNKIPGKKLIKGSVENYLYYYNAQAIIFSHAPSADIAPYNFAVPVLNRFHKKTFKVFLNHGAISFKKRKPMNAKLKKLIDELMKSYNMATAISDFERNIMVNEWMMDDEAVCVLGSARQDNLPLNKEAKSKDILYMPTWRDWIKFGEGKFTDTEYFKNIMMFLNDERLNNVLDEKNVNIKFYMHHLMHEFIDDVKSNITGKRIVFLDKDVTVADEITSSIANITDYSGVAMDFLYMNRPILFYQFDVDKYKKEVDSYIDLDNEMFGYLAYNKDQAVDELIKLIESNFEVKKDQEDARNKFFAYNDNQNCERIYNCIIKKLNK